MSMKGVRCFFSAARIWFSTPLESALDFGWLSVSVAVGGIRALSLCRIDEEGRELPHVLLQNGRQVVLRVLEVPVLKRRPVDGLRDERAEVRLRDLEDGLVVEVVRQAEALAGVFDHPQGRGHDRD